MRALIAPGEKSALTRIHSAENVERGSSNDELASDERLNEMFSLSRRDLSMLGIAFSANY